MNPILTPNPLRATERASQVTNSSIAQLVGEVFDSAPLADKSRLLSHLMKPLGLLSLVAIANGIFAKIRFRSSWPDMQIALEDAQNVQTSDVITLVNYVQQVSTSAVDSLSDMLTASPLVTSSTAAALLVTLLLQRTTTRRASDLEDISTAMQPR